MRKSLSLVLVTMLGAATLTAATLAGVTLPDSVKVGDKTLVLNGLGLRSKMMFKVYVAGLYVEQKSSDGNAIVNADAPKRITLHFVRNVSNDQIKEAIVDAFDAMRSDRPYRKCMPLSLSLEEIRTNLGTQFDPDLGEMFLQTVGDSVTAA